MAITGSKTFTLGVNVEANARQAINELDKLSGKAKTTATAIVNGLESMAKISAGITAALVTPLGLGARAAINMSAEMETAGLAFESLIGNAEQAKKLFADLVKFSSQSPLPLNDLRDGAKLMLGFGHGVEEIIPKLKLLGTVVRGLELPGGMLQAVRALEDLRAGSFNQMYLGNLGITRDILKAQGIQFSKAGQLESSGREAYEAAMEYFEERFSKMADKADRLMATRIGNITDKLRNQVAPAIGDAFAGSFGELVDDVNIVIDKIVKTLADPRVRESIKDMFEDLTEPIKRTIDWLDRVADSPRTFETSIRRLTNTIEALGYTTLWVAGAAVGARFVSWIIGGVGAVTKLVAWIVKLNAAIKTAALLNIPGLTTALTTNIKTMGGFRLAILGVGNAFRSAYGASLVMNAGLGIVAATAIALVATIVNLTNQIIGLNRAAKAMKDEADSQMNDLYRQAGSVLAGKTDEEKAAIKKDFFKWSIDNGVYKEGQKVDTRSSQYTSAFLRFAREKGYIKDEEGTTAPTGGTASDSATKTKKQSDDLIEAAKIYEAALANVGKATNLTHASCADAVGMILESATGIEGLSKTLDDRAYQLRDQLRSQFGFKDIPLSDVRAGDIIFHLPAGPESGAGNHTIISSGAISGVGTGTVGVKGISGGDKPRGISGKIVSGYKNTYDEATTFALRAGGSSLDYGNAMTEIEQYFTDLMTAEKELEQIRFDRSIAELDDMHRLEKEYQRAYDDMKAKREAVKNALTGGDPLEVTNARLEYEKSLSTIEDIERQVIDENYKLVESERELAEARREHLLELDKRRSDGAAVMKGIQDQIDALNNKFEAAADFIKQLNQGLTDRVNAITGGGKSYRQGEFDKASQAYEDEAQRLADFGYSTDYINERLKPFADQVVSAANNLNIFNKSVASIGAGIVETLNVSIGEALTGEEGTKLSDVVKDKIGAITDSIFGSEGVGGVFGGLVEGVAGGLIDKYLNKATTWVSKLFGGGSKKPVEVNGVPVVWVANFDAIARGFTLPEPAVYSGRYGGGNTVRVSSINVNVSSDDDIGEAAAEAVARSINRKLSAVTRHRK